MASLFTLRRTAARVLLLDQDGRVLLINSTDPAAPAKGTWWELPGGGIHRGESSADAAARELYEETGITGAEIGPCVWVRDTEFDFGGMHFEQVEHIHVARCEETLFAPAALESLEVMAFLDHRWWTSDEVAEAADHVFYPTRLPELLPAVVAGDYPLEPLAIGH